MTEKQSSPTKYDEKRPPIRTMRSDVEELYKDTKPSLIQIISREENFPSEKPQETSRKPILFYSLIALSILVVVSAGAGLYYLNFLLPSKVQPPVKVQVPAPFFATESSRTVTLDASNRTAFLKTLEDSAREPLREGTFERVVIKLKDGPEERFLTMADLVELLRMDPPKDLLARLTEPVMLFFFASSGKIDFGFAAKTQDLDRTFIDMLDWESSIIVDFRPLFFNQKIEASITRFEDRTYRNTDWRFKKLSPEADLGIGYMLYPASNKKLLVVTTGKEMMETVINRLADAK